MRRVISIVLGVVLLAAGVYVLYMQLFHSLVIQGQWLASGFAMAFAGAYIILVDSGLIKDQDE